MGLDIGFNLYKKKPFDEERKLVEADLDIYTNVCGRTDTTYSWGEHFKFNKESTETPVFQKELDGKEEKLAEFSVKYKFLPLETFKETVMYAVNETFEICQGEKLDLLKRINSYKEEIKELRDLQKDCTEDQNYAFGRWEKMIQANKQMIEELQEYYDSYNDEDYQYTHAIAVKDLLEDMEKYLKEDKYYVIPYYSY